MRENKIFRNIPNALTVLRFLLIPVILYYVFKGNYILAFIFFTISGLTDIADGCIARKFNLISTFGKLMDPLADKLTQICTLASLAITNIIPMWILIVVLLKEFIMIVGASFLYGKDVVVYSRWYGKLATVLLYIAIVFSLLSKQFDIHGFIGNIDIILYSCALISTLFALVMYAKDMYVKGFIDKQDLKKDVIVAKKDTKKKKSKKDISKKDVKKEN